MPLEDIDLQENVAVASGKVDSPPVEEVRLAPPSDAQTDETPAKESTTEPATEEMITVSRSELDAIKKQIRVLEGSVSSNALAQAQSKEAPKQLPSAYLKVFQDKIVIGWKSEKAELLYNPMNPNSPVGEVLKATYYFIDGTNSGIVDQVLFTRCEDRVIVRIVGDDGREVKVKCEQLITSNEDLKGSFKMPVEAITVRKDFLNP